MTNRRLFRRNPLLRPDLRRRLGNGRTAKDVSFLASYFNANIPNAVWEILRSLWRNLGMRTAAAIASWPELPGVGQRPHDVGARPEYVFRGSANLGLAL